MYSLWPGFPNCVLGPTMGWRAASAGYPRLRDISTGGDGFITQSLSQWLIKPAPTKPNNWLCVLAGAPCSEELHSLKLQICWSVCPNGSRMSTKVTTMSRDYAIRPHMAQACLPTQLVCDPSGPKRTKEPKLLTTSPDFCRWIEKKKRRSPLNSLYCGFSFS